MKRKLMPAAKAQVKPSTSQFVISTVPRIYQIRGHQVVLDVDLAASFDVLTKRLNEAVKRNAERFPDDFCFQLTAAEWQSLRSQFATSKEQVIDNEWENASEFLELDARGGRQYQPYVFTEHGVTMVAGLLRSPKAVALSIHIVREFVRLRREVVHYAELSRRMHQLEERLGDDVKEIWDVLHHMLMLPETKPAPIGFIQQENKDSDRLSKRSRSA